jgi:hypothetical protein
MDKNTQYQVCTPDERMMRAYANIISGKPDCMTVRGNHDTLEAARRQAVSMRIKGIRAIVRRSDNSSPQTVLSDFYRLDPFDEPDLTKKSDEYWEEYKSKLDKDADFDLWWSVTQDGFRHDTEFDRGFVPLD